MISFLERIDSLPCFCSPEGRGGRPDWSACPSPPGCRESDGRAGYRVSHSNQSSLFSLMITIRSLNVCERSLSYADACSVHDVILKSSCPSLAQKTERFEIDIERALIVCVLHSPQSPLEESLCTVYFSFSSLTPVLEPGADPR